LTVVSTHFSTWAVFAQTFQTSASVGGNVLAPVPASIGQPICLYSAKELIASTWTVYNLMGERVASLSFTTQPAECWPTRGMARGLYYVKLVMTFDDGSTATQWQKVVLK
jgi:hypothetical protein